jgi:hypothetical protein
MANGKWQMENSFDFPMAIGNWQFKNGNCFSNASSTMATSPKMKTGRPVWRPETPCVRSRF